MKHSMLLPHELVGCFYKRPDLWSLVAGGPGETWHDPNCTIAPTDPDRTSPAQALRRYWEGEDAIDNDFFCRHPVLEATRHTYTYICICTGVIYGVVDCI